MADEFADKLNAVLGNPEAMGQIMSIARAISGDGEGTVSDETESQALPAPSAPIQSPSSAQAPDLSGIMNILGSLSGGGQSSAAASSNPLSALGDLDPRIIQTGMQIISELGNTDDRKTALLTALRPFLKEERFSKVDRAVQIAKLSRVIRVAFQLFKEGGGDNHV